MNSDEQKPKLIKEKILGTVSNISLKKGEFKLPLPEENTVGSESIDAFLCHNSSDKPLVRTLATILKERGISVWLDEWDLMPGRHWQEAIEEIIQKVTTAVVLVGSDGIGPWQDMEMRTFLSQFVKRSIPIIPTLLDGAPEKPELPLFMSEFTWVDMRSGMTKEAVDRLQWGITGKKPGGK